MKKFIDVGDKAIRGINRTLYVLSVIMLIGMVFNTVLAVVFNKLLSRAFPIPIDYSGYLLLMVAALGYAGYQYKNGFVRVTMLTDVLPPKLSRVTEILNFLILIGFYFFLAYQCLLTANSVRLSGQKMISIAWKVYPYHYVLACGILWTTVVTVFQLIRYLYTGEVAGRND